MAYDIYRTSGIRNDPNYYNKPRYRHEVLVGNWFEERAAKDPSFLPLPQTVKGKEKENLENTARKVSFKENEQPANVEKNHDKVTAKPSSEGNEKNSDAICPSDILRGYYSTTYKRSYGPRHGYIYMNSLPPSIRTQTLEQSGGTTKISPGDTRFCCTTGNSSGTQEGIESCKRCVQLAETDARRQETLGSSQSGPCLRCLQLSNLNS